MSARADVVVIGGGIVGMATSLALLERKPRTLLVLEAETELAQHQTGRNSGVIHSGLYYKPGSLKAQLCAGGREALFAFCNEHGIVHERCGKVIVATEENELSAVEELLRRAKANGLSGVERIGPEQIREREPHVRGIAGLWVPETGIVKYSEVLAAMAKEVERQGGEVRMGARVIGVDRRSDGWVLSTPAGSVETRNLVNCAGLHSDRVARMCGEDPGVRIVPFRGEYYDLIEPRRGLCKNLIYPVPDPRFPFLGVHFTRSTDGVVEAGPNAVLALEREGYSKTSFSLRDVLEIAGYGGFWKMASQHWRMGSYEMWRSFSKTAFVHALQKLIPEIQESDLVPGRAGVRAQALAPDGKLVDDFQLVEREGALHVLNAPSPAATASLAIGRSLAESADRVFRT